MIKGWYEKYRATGDILKVSLKEYDLVSEESSHILGETALVDDLYFEIIDFKIDNVGSEMVDAIKSGGKTTE